jgi:hypothetical protein
MHATFRFKPLLDEEQQMLTTKSQPAGSDVTTCAKSASIVQRDQLKFVSIPSGTLVKVLPEPSPIWLIIGGVRYGYTSWKNKGDILLLLITMTNQKKNTLR